MCAQLLILSKLILKLRCFWSFGGKLKLGNWEDNFTRENIFVEIRKPIFRKLENSNVEVKPRVQIPQK